MAQLDFPGSPTNGQIFTPVAGGPSWQWDGQKWVAATTASTAYAPITDPVFLGNPQAPQPAAGDADASIATTKFVSDAVATSLHDVGRNYLHNSMMAVAQRGAGPWTLNNTYTVDRWLLGVTADTVSVSRVSVSDADKAAIGDESALFALSNTFTGNAAAGANNYVEQRIENVRRLSGKTVTLSFWAVANAGLKLGINAYQWFGTGGSPSTFVQVLATGLSVTLTTTAARYSVTFAVPSTAGTALGTNSDDATWLRFFYSSGATTNAAAGNIGVQGTPGIVNIWGVQLELGPTATPLEKLDPVTQLQQCQRFYQVGQINISGYSGAAGATAYATSLPTVTLRSTNATTAVTGGGNSNLGTSTVTYNGLSFGVSAVVTAIGNYVFNTVFSASADL